MSDLQNESHVSILQLPKLIFHPVLGYIFSLENEGVFRLFEMFSMLQVLANNSGDNCSDLIKTGSRT